MYLMQRRAVSALLFSLMLVACADQDDGAGPLIDTALPLSAEFSADQASIVAEYLREPRFAVADLERGELLSLACQACHTLSLGQQHNLGPNLYGVFGRRAAALMGFEYSDALRASGIVWTPQALEAWLAEPATFVVGNNMAFAGFRSATDRRDLLAFLIRATSEQEPE